MKYYLFCLLSALFQNITFAEEVLLNYTIGYDAHSNCLPITVDFTGSESGKTEVYYPREVWGIDLSEQVNELKLRNPRQYFNQNETSTSVIHHPKDNISLSYKICSLQSENLSYVEPYISDSISHFIGSMGLVIPKFDDKDIYHINFNYKLPRNMKIYNSLSNMKTIESSNLEQLLMVFGDFKSVKLFDGNYLYTNSHDIPVDKLVSDLNKILKTESQLFKGNKVPHISIWLIKHHLTSSQQNKHLEIPKNISGTKLDNSIIVESYNYNDSYNEILQVITHELLHRWFGGVIPQNKINEGYDKWFFEGFTEFYTYKTLLLAGLMDKTIYINNYNKILKNYFASPFNKLTDKEIDKFYWKDYSLQVIPYMRGNIIAQELDLRIRDSSKNSNNLENVISEIISSYKKNKHQDFSCEFFLSALQKITGYDGNKFVKEASQLGKFDNIWTNMDKYKVRFQQEKFPYYGFDLLKTIISGKITEVDKNSEAYKAHLRNGQQFYGYSDNEIGKMEVKIQEKKKVKTIKFLPIAQSLSVPQYFK